MKTKEEIEEFILDNKLPQYSACALGCGQIIHNQVFEHKKHDCPLPNCVKWMTKCKNCLRVLGPNEELLTGKIEIYQVWDKHNRKVKKFLEEDDK